MSEEEGFRDLRAEAWSEFIYPRTAVANLAEPPVDCGFIRAARVYERELAAVISANADSDRDYADELRVISEARLNAYQMLDALPPDDLTPERYGLTQIINLLDKVLGPDLVREADPTGQVLKSLPYERRKRMLDALDSAQKLAKEHDGEPPQLILIVEDEMGPILEKAKQLREQTRGEGE